MSTICYRRATLTSTRVSTSYTEGATYRNVVYTSAARTYLVPYGTSTSCITRSSSRACATYVSSRYSISPGRPYTSQVLIHTQRTIYITNLATYYSTSCTVSRRPTPAPAAPTPPPRPVTTYITVGTTTTRTSVFYPSQTTVDSPTIVDGSTVIDVPSDFPVTVDGGVAGPKKVPVGAIVGGVLGGLVAAGLLGFLVYFMVFKKSRRHSQESSREHLDHQRPLSVGQSSPSEGSSAVLHPQMQEYGVRDSYVSNGQAGHQYAHVRQDSMGMAFPVAGVEQISPVSSPGPGTEQGHYYPRGQYVGHAEIQDSRF